MAELSYRPLDQVDGSAEFSFNGFKVLAAVNGPLEAPRRDELPEEAAIDVVVRSATGIPGIRERHFESIIHRTLRNIIRVRDHPRTLIQVILQVVETPEKDLPSSRPPQAASCLELLSPLLNASSAALLSSAIPMNKAMTAVVVAASHSGSIMANPSATDLEKAASTHVLAYSSQGEVLVVESEGDFNIDIWESAAEVAKRTCYGEPSRKKKAQQASTGFEGHLRSFVSAAILSP